MNADLKFLTFITSPPCKYICSSSVVVVEIVKVVTEVLVVVVEIVVVVVLTRKILRIYLDLNNNNLIINYNNSNNINTYTKLDTNDYNDNHNNITIIEKISILNYSISLTLLHLYPPYSLINPHKH